MYDIQVVRKDLSAWSKEERYLRDVLRSVSTMSMVQCVAMLGILEMPKLCADNWDFKL